MHGKGELSTMVRALAAGAVAATIGGGAVAQTARPGIADSSSRQIGADRNMVLPTLGNVADTMFKQDITNFSNGALPSGGSVAGFRERTVTQSLGPYFPSGQPVESAGESLAMSYLADQQRYLTYQVCQDTLGDGGGQFCTPITVTAATVCGARRNNESVAWYGDNRGRSRDPFGTAICAPEGTRTVTFLERVSTESATLVQLGITDIARMLAGVRASGLQVDAIGGGFGSFVCQKAGFPKGAAANTESARSWSSCGDNVVAAPNGAGGWTAINACSAAGALTAIGCLK